MSRGGGSREARRAVERGERGEHGLLVVVGCAVASAKPEGRRGGLVGGARSKPVGHPTRGRAVLPPRPG